MLERIEKYRILEEIGQGGMSVVYRGHDDALDRDVAVKVMHKHLARDPDARERFSREARAVARLTHHHIPEIYDFSSSDGELNYLVSELIEGASLAALLREGSPMLPEVGVMITFGVAQALAHAHAHQIIHRDVKPENILLGRDGVVKLTDFGIAQIVGLESMTITGTLVGSPAHMSPEQIEGDVVLDYRADIWALGTVLYVVSTGGALPFDSATPHGVLKKIVDGQYADPRRINPHVGSSLTAIIARCLQVDRDERYASIDELAEDLRLWLADRGVEDPEAELTAWMADREGYQSEMARRLVVVLMARAEEALDAGRRHEALEGFGRVLTLDSNHAEATRRLRSLRTGLRRRKTLKQGFWFVLGVLTVAVVAWVLWQQRPPANAPLRVPEVPAQRLATLGAAPATPELEPPGPPPVPAATGRTVGRAIAESLVWVPKLRPGDGKTDGSNTPPGDTKPRLAPLQLTVDPPAVILTLDGRAWTPGQTRQVELGSHTAKLVHPGCADCKPTIYKMKVKRTFDGKPMRKHLRFEFNPVKIRVHCADGAVVWIDGRRKGACGKVYSVRMYSPTPRLGKVKVVFPSGEEKERRYTFRPGEPLDVTIR